VFGVGPAILAGDALLSLASILLLDDPSPRRVRANHVLASATAELIAGQGLDLAFEGREDVTVDDCLSMCAGKTGALLSAAVVLGAVLGGADAPTETAMRDYGAHLGLAFQAVDDLLGIWGRPETTGKPAFSDLQQRKRSLPVVAALQAGGPRAEELADLLHAPTLDAADLARAADLVEANGGRAFTAAEARRQLGLALEVLDRIDLEPDPARELSDLARFVVDREL
jgi:geranylgeranyl diphosphate synthase type I